MMPVDNADSGIAMPDKADSGTAMPDTPDPVEIAMAALASGAVLPDVARDVLESHARLIKAQVTELRLQHVGARVQAALWGLLALVAVLALGLAAVAVWRAAHSSSIVVEPFNVPPTIAEQGLTGEVLAAQLLDQLSILQSNSYSLRANAAYAGSWDDAIKIDIPNTGATVDQVWKLLRRWLGNETRITGEIIVRGETLVLTARTAGTPSRRYTGKPADREALITQAAEGIYRDSQPYRFAIYLANKPGRRAEAEAILLEVTRSAPELDQKWAYVGLSLTRRTSGDLRGGVDMAKAALAIDPDMRAAKSQLAIAEYPRGHDQSVTDIARTIRNSSSDSDEDEETLAFSICDLERRAATLERDLVTMTKHCKASDARIQNERGAVAGRAVYKHLFRHEFPATLVPRQAVFFRPDERDYLIAQLMLMLAVEKADVARLPQELAALSLWTQEMDKADVPRAPYYKAARPTQDVPQISRALSLLGRHADAAAMIAQTPLDCYFCVRTRGVLAHAAGRPAEAEKWFAQGVRQGPRLAPAYVEWAQLLIRQRRFTDAEAKLETAERLSRDWADPLKYWGDALIGAGNIDAALLKYAEAGRRAPNWGGLQLAWGEALARKGDTAGAAGKFRVAGGLWLSDSERARLALATQRRDATPPRLAGVA